MVLMKHTDDINTFKPYSVGGSGTSNKVWLVAESVLIG